MINKYSIKELSEITGISTKQINSFRKSKLITYNSTSPKKHYYNDITIKELNNIVGFEELRNLFTSITFREKNLNFQTLSSAVKKELLIILLTKPTMARKVTLSNMLISKTDIATIITEKHRLYYNEPFGTLRSYQLQYGDIVGTRKHNNTGINRGSGNTLEGHIAKYGKSNGTKLYKVRNNKRAHTLENFINKHGEVKGRKMFTETMAKKGQSLEKFIIKYGEIDGLKRYNDWVSNCKSSEENFIKRHGSEKLGKQKWQEFIDKSKSTLPNFIKRHGEKDGEKRYKQYCAHSANTKENFIRVHGEELGNEKCNKYINNANTFRASTESLEIFNPLTEKLVTKLDFDDIFYGVENSFEFKMMYDEEHYYSYDYTIESLQIIIEYNGSHVHPSKEKLTKQEWNNWRSPWTKETADSKYKFDSDKIKFAEDNGYIVLVIWDYEDKSTVIEKCLKLIEERI